MKHEGPQGGARRGGARVRRTGERRRLDALSVRRLHLAEGARLKDGAGHGVKGVKVTFSFKLKSRAVRRQATTVSRGVARVKITPVPDTAPQGVRVNVKVNAIYRGVTLTAAT